MPHEIIDGREIVVHFPGILGRELSHLQVNDNEASELQMIEQQIEVIVFVSDGQRHLSSDKGEPGSEFQQELLDVIDQSAFQLPFDRILLQGEEVEQVGIFQRLLGEIGLWRGQRPGKVTDGLPLAAEQIAFDLHCENCSTPACSMVLQAYHRRWA